MLLSEFIESTIYQIALGVERARLQAKDYVAVNPGSLNGRQIEEKSFIRFEASLVVAESIEGQTSSTAKRGGEISVASLLKLSGDKSTVGAVKTDAEAEATHRVSFEVPIYMNANFANNPATAARAVELIGPASAAMEAANMSNGSAVESF